MSASGLDVFDKTLQTTHIRLNEVMEVTGPDRQVAWHVLGVVLRAVRDRIPLELAVYLGSQLPLLVRGLYNDQRHAPGRTGEKPRSLGEVLRPIGGQLAQIRPINARNATQAVFSILSRHVTPGRSKRSGNPSQPRCRPFGSSRPKPRSKWSGSSGGVKVSCQVASAPQGDPRLGIPQGMALARDWFVPRLRQGG